MLNQLLLAAALLAVAMMGVPGSARSASATPIHHPVTPASVHSGSAFAPVVSNGYSFADVVDLPTGAAYGLQQGDAVGRAPDAIWAQRPNVAEAPPARAQDNGALTEAVYVIDGAVEDLSEVNAPKNLSAARTGIADLRPGAGFLFSTSEIPRPAGWITLICSLIVLAFMARRKRNPFAS